MTLALGSPNLPGNEEYLRRTGRLSLRRLSPNYVPGIGDGIFLPERVRYPVQFWIDQ